MLHVRVFVKLEWERGRGGKGRRAPSRRRVSFLNQTPTFGLAVFLKKLFLVKTSLVRAVMHSRTRRITTRNNE